MSKLIWVKSIIAFDINNSLPTHPPRLSATVPNRLFFVFLVSFCHSRRLRVKTRENKNENTARRRRGADRLIVMPRPTRRGALSGNTLERKSDMGGKSITF